VQVSTSFSDLQEFGSKIIGPHIATERPSAPVRPYAPGMRKNRHQSIAVDAPVLQGQCLARVSGTSSIMMIAEWEITTGRCKPVTLLIGTVQRPLASMTMNRSGFSNCLYQSMSSSPRLRSTRTPSAARSRTSQLRGGNGSAQKSSFVSA
jgi:hypothetical protein